MFVIYFSKFSKIDRFESPFRLWWTFVSSMNTVDHTGASVLAQMSTEVVCELMLLIGTKAGLTSLSKYQNPDFTIGWIVSKVLLKFVKIGIFSMYLSRHQVESWTVSVANADAAVLTQMYCRSRLRTNTVHSNWNRLEVLVKTGRLCIFRKS